MYQQTLNKREQFLQWLVNVTSKVYLNIFKAHKAQWKYSKSDLRSFPTGSLGREIGNFLDEHNIDLIPKAESHDVYHVLTGYPTTAKDEIAMQSWLVGNGKWTTYTLGCCLLGAIIIPEYWSYYKKAFQKGRKTPKIVNWTFEDMLYDNVAPLKQLAQSQATLAYACK